MDFNNDHLKEIEKLEKKETVYTETVSSIHNTFVYAGSLVHKNMHMLAVLILIGVGINLIGVNAFSEFIGEFQNIDPTNLSEVEQKSDHLLNLFFKGLGISIILQLISSMFFITFAAYICGRNVEDATFANDLGNVFTLMLSVILQLALIVIIKQTFIIIGFMVLIPGIIFLAQMLLVQYVFIFERNGIYHAFSRSAELMYGVKGNFLTFITYASLIFIPAWIADFISGGLAVIVHHQGSLSLPYMAIALMSEAFKQYVWFVYSVGACLLYLKRSASNT